MQKGRVAGQGDDPLRYAGPGQPCGQTDAGAHAVFQVHDVPRRQLGPYHAAGLAGHDKGIPPAVALHDGQQRLQGRDVGAVVAQWPAAGHGPRRFYRRGPRPLGQESRQPQNDVRGEKLACAWQVPAAAPIDRQRQARPLGNGLYLDLDIRCGLLDDENGVDLTQKDGDAFGRQGMETTQAQDAQRRIATLLHDLDQLVVRIAGGDDAQRALPSFSIQRRVLESGQHLAQLGLKLQVQVHHAQGQDVESFRLALEANRQGGRRRSRRTG